MTLAPASILALAIQCAPNVAPQTVAAIVRTESAGRVLAINVNGGAQPARPNDVSTAIQIARRQIALGYSVDMGLGQINSRNMASLGLTWDTVFEPCANVRALGLLLTRNYQSVRRDRDDQSALRAALSMYNTGSASGGFRNGYVAKVIRNARPSGHFAPATAVGETPNLEITASPAAEIEVIPAPPPGWNLFERAAWERRFGATASNTEATR